MANKEGRVEDISKMTDVAEKEGYLAEPVKAIFRGKMTFSSSFVW